MIRVLHFAGIINRYDIIDTVLTRLDRSRFQVSALTGIPPRQTAPYNSGEDYPTRCLNFEFNRNQYARMFSELVAEIRRIRPHILQAHHYDENVVASVAVRLTRVPAYVIGRHYSDHIYFLTRGLKRKVFLAGEDFCNKTATKIAVPTQQVADLLTERQSVPNDKVTVIPFGLDFARYHTSSPSAPEQLRHEFGLDGKYLVVACCRLNTEKGLEYLLQAMAQVRSQNEAIRLVIVGSGPDESRLRRLNRELALEDIVQFVGWRDDALDWIAGADLIVQPSFAESFCQVLFEALAFGKPVIMTPVGAAPQVIGKNERGRLVPKGESKALANAMCELMANNELGLKLGESGRTYIRQNMGADLTARRYEELYERVVNGGI